MNDEERQRTMDFILRQQAKVSNDIDKSEARIARLERTLKLAIRAGLRERREWRERYAALVDAQVRTEEVVRGLGAATQRNTEDINRLARIVERNSTERNGGNGGDGRGGEDNS
jgi:hypothetical protein